MGLLNETRVSTICHEGEVQDVVHRTAVRELRALRLPGLYLLESDLQLLRIDAGVIGPQILERSPSGGLALIDSYDAVVGSLFRASTSQANLDHWLPLSLRVEKRG